MMCPSTQQSAEGGESTGGFPNPPRSAAEDSGLRWVEEVGGAALLPQVDFMCGDAGDVVVGT